MQPQAEVYTSNAVPAIKIKRIGTCPNLPTPKQQNLHKVIKEK
jgi:hypothetical protein